MSAERDVSELRWLLREAESQRGHLWREADRLATKLRATIKRLKSVPRDDAEDIRLFAEELLEITGDEP